MTRERCSSVAAGARFVGLDTSLYNYNNTPTRHLSHLGRSLLTSVLLGQTHITQTLSLYDCTQYHNTVTLFSPSQRARTATTTTAASTPARMYRFSRIAASALASAAIAIC